MRKICAGYWLLLTVLLFAQNPWGWAGSGRRVDAVYEHVEPISHLVSFTLLTLLVLAARWPLPRVTMLGLLAGYGAATELIQSQIPGRRMQLSDLIQDLAGILAGCVFYWAWRRLSGRWKTEPSPLEEVWQRPRRREPLLP